MTRHLLILSMISLVDAMLKGNIQLY